MQGRFPSNENGKYELNVGTGCVTSARFNGCVELFGISESNCYLFVEVWRNALFWHECIEVFPLGLSKANTGRNICIHGFKMGIMKRTLQ